MADCFISYRRTPSAPVATMLQSKLESRHGIDAYVDTTRTDGTRVSFPDRLMTAIAEAPVFVCLLGEREGQHTLQSEWVLKEIQQAYDLRKFCIPVFQESYRPLPDMPPAVDYLLGFDGIHIFDQKNIMVDESVGQLAALIRPQLQKRRSRGVSVVAGLGVVVVVALVVAGAAMLANPLMTPETTPEGTTAVAAATEPASPTNETITSPTDAPTASPTATVTEAPPTATDTPMPTPNATEREQTLQAEMVNLQTEQALTAAAIAQMTATAQTATADASTDTPTPDDRATAAARLTQTVEAATVTQAWIDSWTDTPTSTYTPTFTPTRTGTFTRTPTFTFTPTRTPTLSPEQIAQTPVSANDAWTPYERDFDGVTMVLVPAGSFQMGNDPEGRYWTGSTLINGVPDGGFQEFTQPFWIDKYEVTQAQFRALGGTKARANGFSGDNRPVENITWFEASDFCALRGARLPTEAEWEYAARGPDSLVYPWGNAWNPDYAVWSGNSGAQTAEVVDANGSPLRPDGASWVGALDMSGNVWEWTSTIYRPYPYDAFDGRENLADSGSKRVLRGGSWNWIAADTRAAARDDYAGDFTSSDWYGFRCARDFQPSDLD